MPGELMTEEHVAQPVGNRLSRKWVLIIILCTLPVFFLFAVLGDDPGRGRAAATFVAALMVVARVRWDLKNHPWFWVTLGSMIVLHVPLIIFIPWPSKTFRGPSFVPVGLLEYGLIYGCFKLVEKRMSGKASSGSSDA